MKKFNFKLDGLLKVREFKEKKIKIELGEILKEIGATEELIAKMNRDIDDTYAAQDELLATASDGKMLQFFPYYIQGRKEDIKNKESLLWSLRKKYNVKIEELALARGEVKVLENFKDKKKIEWNKERDKKEMETIEEILMMRRNGSEGSI
jgi:flagellar FliJ protein